MAMNPGLFIPSNNQSDGVIEQSVAKLRQHYARRRKWLKTAIPRQVHEEILKDSESNYSTLE